MWHEAHVWLWQPYHINTLGFVRIMWHVNHVTLLCRLEVTYSISGNVINWLGLISATVLITFAYKHFVSFISSAWAPIGICSQAHALPFVHIWFTSDLLLPIQHHQPTLPAFAHDSRFTISVNRHGQIVYAISYWLAWMTSVRRWWWPI
jgi:hypothetical protein